MRYYILPIRYPEEIMIISRRLIEVHDYAIYDTLISLMKFSGQDYEMMLQNLFNRVHRYYAGVNLPRLL